MLYKMILDILNGLGMGMAVPVFGLILFGIGFAWRKKDRFMNAWRGLTGSISDLSTQQAQVSKELHAVSADVGKLSESLECHMRNHAIHVNGEDFMYRDVCMERHHAVDANMAELRRKVFRG